MHAATANGFEVNDIATRNGAAKPPARKRTLRDIGDDLEALDDLLAESEGDISECEEAVAAFFAELGHDEKRKMGGYCDLIARWQSEVDIRRAEVARLNEDARIIEDRIKYLKTRMKTHLETHGHKSYATDFHRITVVKNGGLAPINWKIEGLDKEPDPRSKLAPEDAAKFVQEMKTYSLDTTLIRDVLASGQTLPFAEIGPRGTHLRIS